MSNYLTQLRIRDQKLLECRHIAEMVSDFVEYSYVIGSLGLLVSIRKLVRGTIVRTRTKRVESNDIEFLVKETRQNLGRRVKNEMDADKHVTQKLLRNIKSYPLDEGKRR